MRHTTHRLARYSALCCCLLLASMAAAARAEASAQPDRAAVHGSVAPLNAAFLQSLLRVPMSEVSGQSLGGRPSQQDFSYTRGMQVPNGWLITPEAWDLRPGKVTSVKDQGPYNTCWSFAAYGSLESCLLTGETRDFSEDNMLRTSGFDYDPYNGGGHIWMSIAYLVRWGGPVNESEDVYGDAFTPAGLTPRKHVQEVNVIPLRAGPLDNHNVQTAVIVYGAVDVSMGFYGSPGGSPYYNPATAAYYYDGYAPNNHEVLIVGWDDNYPAANFATTPPGNGAFIVKNSWGSSFGENGYFYVSYYDSVLGRINNPMAVYNNSEPTTNYTGVYQYDPLGQVNVLGVAGSIGWFANVYTATATSALGAVGFYTAAPDTDYSVYTGSSLASKTLATSGTLAGMGYHTVTLPSPVGVTKGQPFVVAVKVTSPGTDFPIAVEYPIAGYSSSATAAPGQSYYSEDGSSWTDATSEFSDMNVCLKAYTVTAATTPPTVTSPNGGESWAVGSSHTITWSTGNGGPVTIALSRDNGTSWETLFASTANDGSESWTVAGAPTTQALVRVANGNGSDTSNATFTIAAAATPPAVTSPNGGESWAVGSSHTITWSTGNGGNVTIALSRDNGTSWETLFASTANDGSESWTVAGAPTTQARVRVSNGNGGDTSNGTFTIAAAVTDVTPPTVSVAGYDAAWHNHEVTLTVTASDAESGVKCLWWSCNDDPSWYQIMGSTGSVTVPAPTDHSWDRNNAIWYYGEDNAGNHPDPVTTHCHVKIDTRKPTPKAPEAASTSRGGTARLRYRVVDARPGSPTATVKITVKNRAGTVVKTLKPVVKAVNTPLAWRFVVPRAWKVGTYRFYVFAVRDSAGNPGVLPAASNKLVVR